MKYEDEDYGYEQYRQKLIDSDQWHKPTIIGSGLKDADKIQRFVHHDPRPDLNFDEDLEKPDYLMGLYLTLISLATLVWFWILGEWLS